MTVLSVNVTHVHRIVFIFIVRDMYVTSLSATMFNIFIVNI